MRILLDTCTFLWIVADPSKLSAKAFQRFTDPKNTVYLSAVSAWEIGVEHGLGKLTLRQSPARLIPDQRAKHQIETLDLTEMEVLLVEHLPSIHSDPFDRMLICQALAHDLVILTPDNAISSYPTVRTEW